MTSNRIPPAELVRNAGLAIPDSQKIAFAIALANSVTDPSQAPGLLRLGREAQNMGEMMAREQFLSECG